MLKEPRAVLSFYTGEHDPPTCHFYKWCIRTLSWQQRPRLNIQRWTELKPGYLSSLL